MDTAAEAFQVVIRRIKEREPHDVAMKIAGFVLLKYEKDEEMIRLAHSPDQAFECVLNAMKNELLPPDQPVSPPDPDPDPDPVVERPMPIQDAPVLDSRTKNASSFSQEEGLDGDDDCLSPESLKRLEMDIIRLLIMNGGTPIPLESLPSQYYATYGRACLAESPRNNGKSSRTHGQHSTILAEEVPRHCEYRSGRSSPCLTGSHGLYFTIPSTFTEEDVAQYFRPFGRVEDVRMPSLLERMFRLVTFSSPETVKNFLYTANPHLIGGREVIFKPYR